MLDGRQRQIGRAIARRRFEAAAEMDEMAVPLDPLSREEASDEYRLWYFDSLHAEPELAPRGGFIDWPVLLIFALVLVTAAGTAYVAVNG